MSRDASYCGVILLLRQLVESGHCTKKEATRVATQIARSMKVEIVLPIT